VRRATVVGALITAATIGVNAIAREPSVLLLRPAHPTALGAEAIVRLRGELLAAGYAVELADIPDGGDVRAAVEAAARPASVDAVVALYGDAPRSAGLLWVVDRASGRTLARPIPHDGEGARSAQISSVRALELLRASFLEAALPPAPEAAATGASRPGVVVVAGQSGPTAASRNGGTRPTAPPAHAEPATSASSSSPQREETTPQPSPGVTIARAAGSPTGGPARVAIEAGGLLLGSLDHLPPAVLPVLRIAVAPVARWPLRARMTVAGLGTRARVNGAQGDAEVSHRLAILEGVWTFRRDQRWQPFVSLGAGATEVSARGLAASGSPAGPTATAWAFVADAGAGLRVVLSQRLCLAGEVHVEGDAPYPAVRYLGAPLATAGRPTLLGGLSLIAWL